MKIGIVGLPNVGKSTLFNALTKSYAADAANFPFCTIEPNVGIVNVKDPRIEKLAEISKTQNLIYATIKFVDIAGLVRGASEGQGLGNKFLSHIREVDAILQVTRHFEDGDISHVEGSIDPIRDIEIIQTELMLSDLEQLEKTLDGYAKKAKSGDKEAIKLTEIINVVVAGLRQGKLVIDCLEDFSAEDKKLLQGYQLLTNKPFIYAVNVAQSELGKAPAIQKEFAEKLKKPVGIVCAHFESEMIEFSADERKEYLSELGHAQHLDHIPTLDDLIAVAFDTVGLMYYFTTGEKETRAWTIPKGSTAPQAAGAIHTDFEKGFIKAEVIAYEDFVADGGWAAGKEKGHVKLEGKEYIVKDGDIMLFRFNN
ncbi:MAG TPA: redox-regulated ATPase YchF [Candidatus Absconditabacterales bacterium]|nr:redox-regulated ATPase YchF [Candidatus Absconditabacterales bacterium]